jgi:hypothetical protein
MIPALENLREKMDEVDINFVRTKKIDYLDTHEKLGRKYILEKYSQYPILDRLRELKKYLFEQEQELINDEYKSELLENRLEKLTNEINLIKSENNSILNDNHLLKKQISNIKKVPTITDYAYIIEQTNKLQHEIHIWTQRVKIVEVSLLNYTEFGFYSFKNKHF